MPVAGVTSTLTSLIGDHGVYAVFLLMAIDAVFPAASELVMVYAGALAAGAFSGQHVDLFGARVSSHFPAYLVMALAGTLGPARKSHRRGRRVAGRNVRRAVARASRQALAHHAGTPRARSTLVRPLRGGGGARRFHDARNPFLRRDPGRSRPHAARSFPRFRTGRVCRLQLRARRRRLGRGIALRPREKRSRLRGRCTRPARDRISHSPKMATN